MKMSILYPDKSPQEIGQLDYWNFRRLEKQFLKINNFSQSNPPPCPNCSNSMMSFSERVDGYDCFHCSYCGWDSPLNYEDD